MEKEEIISQIFWVENYYIDFWGTVDLFDDLETAKEFMEREKEKHPKETYRIVLEEKRVVG